MTVDDRVVLDLMFLDLDAEIVARTRDGLTYRELAQQAIHRLAYVTDRAVYKIIQLEEQLIRPPEDADERSVARVRRVLHLREYLHDVEPDNGETGR